jgi:hypothetical protein
MNGKMSLFLPKIYPSEFIYNQFILILRMDITTLSSKSDSSICRCRWNRRKRVMEKVFTVERIDNFFIKIFEFLRTGFGPVKYPIPKMNRNEAKTMFYHQSAACWNDLVQTTEISDCEIVF